MTATPRAYVYESEPLETDFTRAFPGVLEIAARLAEIEPAQIFSQQRRCDGRSLGRAYLAWLCRRTRTEMSWKEIAALTGLDWTGMRAAFLKLDEKRRTNPELHQALHIALGEAREAMRRVAG